MPLIGIRGLDGLILHAACQRDLLGKVLISLHHGILDLIADLHLEDVVHEVVGLAVNQHSSEIDFLHPLPAQQFPEQPVPRAGIYASYIWTILSLATSY